MPGKYSITLRIAAFFRGETPEEYCRATYGQDTEPRYVPLKKGPSVREYYKSDPHFGERRPPNERHYPKGH